MGTSIMMSGGEEFELRLGLPGGGGGAVTPHDVEVVAPAAANVARKRGFSETEDDEGGDEMSLKLNLQLDGNNSSSAAAVSSSLDLKKNNDMNNNKAAAMATVKNNVVDSTNHHDPATVKPPAKAQVVGWPPVRSFRKNIMTVPQSNSKEMSMMNGNENALVKVSIDGAPYLRKVDLKMYRSYQELSDALGKMFSSFTIGSHGMIDFMNESKLMDLLNDSDYVPTYEDKDGDWMLVGDVPWEMFVESCKRLRIMKGKEAVGLAPRAMQKCKNRPS